MVKFYDKQLKAYGVQQLYFLNKERNRPVKKKINLLFFFPVPVCAITASGVPGGTPVSMNSFSTLCG
jgi:hypothetical protein